MTKADDIFAFLKELAPLSLAEDYDNCGMLAGCGGQEVSKALIALDITREVCEEAECKGAQLVISHHPVIFRPVRSVRGDGDTAALWELARRGLTAICMHTNIDIAPGGVNDTLARVLGLEKLDILKVTCSGGYKKIAVFVPEAYADAVREAMTEAGAGRFGHYDGCFFETAGTGRFRPIEGARPFIGKSGVLAAVKEVRLEAVCRARDAGRVIAAMKRAHPYEEPAYDLFEDEALSEPCGVGMLAGIKEKMPLDDFARTVNAKLHAGGVKVCRAGGEVWRVAVCSGAWDDELTLRAKTMGADTILTGELKHSSMLLALSLGLNVVAAGHFATENVICARLEELLRGAFENVVFEVAQSNRNPAYFMN